MDPKFKLKSIRIKPLDKDNGLPANDILYFPPDRRYSFVKILEIYLSVV